MTLKHLLDRCTIPGAPRECVCGYCELERNNRKLSYTEILELINRK